jgi:hypothetical protein
MVMKGLHEGPLRGHFAIEIMHRKILDVGYWWPTMCIIIVDLVMHVKEHEDWQLKVLQS